MSKPQATESSMVIEGETVPNAKDARYLFKTHFEIPIIGEADQMIDQVVFPGENSDEEKFFRITTRTVHSLGLKDGASRSTVYETAERAGLLRISPHMFLTYCLTDPYREAGMVYAAMEPMIVNGQEKIFAFVTRPGKEKPEKTESILVAKEGRADHIFHAACLLAFLQPK